MEIKIDTYVVAMCGTRVFEVKASSVMVANGFVYFYSSDTLQAMLRQEEVSTLFIKEGS